MSRFDRWSADGMPQGDAALRVQMNISRVMKGVLEDARKGISQSASMIPDNKREETPPRAPGAGSVPLASPPGVAIIDQMCDAQDRRDRLAAIQQELTNAEIERRLVGTANAYHAKDRGPLVKSEYEPFSREWMGKGFDDNGDDD